MKVPEGISPNYWSTMHNFISNSLNCILEYVNIESMFALGLLSPGTHASPHHLLAFTHSAWNH